MKTMGKFISFLLLTAIGFVAGRYGFQAQSASEKTGSFAAESRHTDTETRSIRSADRSDSEVLRDPRTGAIFSSSMDRLSELIEQAGTQSIYSVFLSDGKRSEHNIVEIRRIFALASHPEILAYFSDQVDEETPVFVVDAAIHRLAEHSIDDALAMWTERNERTGKSDGIGELIRVWSQEDAAAAENWIDQSLEKESEHQAALFALLDESLKDQPELVKERLFEVTGTWQSIELASRFVRQLKKGEFAPTADLFLSQKVGKWQYQSQLADLLTHWGKQDSSAMLQWMLARPRGELNDHTISQVGGIVSKKDPAGFIREIGPHLSKNMAFSEMAGQAWLLWLADSTDEEEAISWFRMYGGDLTASWSGVRHGFWNWSADQTKSTIDKALSLPKGEFSEQVVSMLLHKLSDSDPKAALNYGKTHLPAGTQKHQFLASALSQHVRSGNDPKWAIDWALENFELGYKRNQAVRWVMSAWTEKNPIAAAEMANQLSGELQKEAFSEIVYSWAEKDPDALLDYIKTSAQLEFAPVMARDAYLRVGLKMGSQKILSDALAMPEGKLREQAIRGLFTGWALADLESSALALDKMNQGSLRDAAITEFIGVAGREDRKVAAIWALSITDTALRKKRLMHQAKRWLKADRSTATQWIESNDTIPADWKSELLP